MTLVSSKLLTQIGTAVRDSQSEHRVLQGQQALFSLRQRNDYERGLAAFLGQASRPNDRLFTLLQLKKMAQMTEQQTVYQLKDIYYQDVDKAAHLVRTLMTHPTNTQWTPLFLTFPFDNMGCLQSIRYLQLLLSLLARPTDPLLQLNFNLIRAGILQLLQVVGQSQQLMRMLTVVLALFYQAALSHDRQLHRESLVDHWLQFCQKSKFYETPLLSLLKMAISNLMDDRKEPLPVGLVPQLILSITRRAETNNQQQSQFDGQILRLIHTNCTILHCEQDLFSFILSINTLTTERYRNILTTTQNSLTTDLSQIFQKDEKSPSEKLSSSIVSSLIEQIFDEHYQIVAQRYQQQQQKPLLVYLLPLLNWASEDGEGQRIRMYARDHCCDVFDLVGKFGTRLRLGGRREEADVLEFMGCLEFMVRFKGVFKIQMLPMICQLLQQVSGLCETLSPLCYVFMEEVWEDIASLEPYLLHQFLLRHLQTLNSNVWDHQLSNYACFLHLADHLEEMYQTLSKMATHDELYQESMRAQKVLVGLLQETGGHNREGQQHFLSLLVRLTATLMSADEKRSWAQYRQLSLDYMSDLVLKLKLQDDPHGIEILSYSNNLPSAHCPLRQEAAS